jgi:hypothetical protein
MKAKGRKISGMNEESGLRESQASYSNDFEANNGLLSMKNACFWKIIFKKRYVGWPAPVAPLRFIRNDSMDFGVPRAFYGGI